MRTIFYTIVQTIVLLAFWPVGLVATLVLPKLRVKLLQKLGFGLAGKLSRHRSRQTFWLHALSVGEITSSLPFLRGIRKEFPQARIIVTVSTTTGYQLASTVLNGIADCISFGPWDFLPVVWYYVRRIRPDLYILVETDFWPTLLSVLSWHGIPSLLVNGRISEKSFQSYQRFRFFIKPMFQQFAALSMQTELDLNNMIRLGIQPRKVHTLGNLKFDCEKNQQVNISAIAVHIPSHCRVLLAGSTHPGEEEVLLTAYQTLRLKFPDLYLILAPRDPKRSSKLCALATSHGMSPALRTASPDFSADLLIIDTLGELASAYALAMVAFVGGSLVAAGGHNPLEAAAQGIPVLFGRHMEDFSEISSELLVTGAARIVDTESLESVLCSLLENQTELQKLGTAAAAYVTSRQGVVPRHLELIRSLMC